MKRLLILVEGQSEQEFAADVLVPHLEGFGLQVVTFIVETSRDAAGRKRRGGGHWKHWQRDLRRLALENRGGEVRFTTMFDLYGLPKDFPGLAEHGSDSNTLRRAEALEAKMAEQIQDYRVLQDGGEFIAARV